MKNLVKNALTLRNPLRRIRVTRSDPWKDRNAPGPGRPARDGRAYRIEPRERPAPRHDIPGGSGGAEEADRAADRNADADARRSARQDASPEGRECADDQAGQGAGPAASLSAGPAVGRRSGGDAAEDAATGRKRGSKQLGAPLSGQRSPAPGRRLSPNILAMHAPCVASQTVSQFRDSCATVLPDMVNET